MLAAVAANMPTESENELYEMPLDEVRRRATGRLDSLTVEEL
jgi:hypothetical protein